MGKNSSKWEVCRTLVLKLHSEISKSLKISKDRKTKFIKISFEHQSIFAYQFLNLIIDELNKITKQIDLDESHPH